MFGGSKKLNFSIVEGVCLAKISTEHKNTINIAEYNLNVIVTLDYVSIHGLLSAKFKDSINLIRILLFILISMTIKYCT